MFLDGPFRVKIFGSGDPNFQQSAVLEARVTGLYGCTYGQVIFVVKDVDTCC